MSKSLHFKICVLGFSGVGKSSIINKLTTGSFDQSEFSTVGVDFCNHKMDIDGTKITLDIWDSAGQEKYHSIVKSYFRDAIGCLLVFDITSSVSFNALGKWLNEFRELAHPQAFVMLVGNKTDFEDQRVITPIVSEEFAREHKLSYIETSALNGDNINEAFERLARGIYHKILNNEIELPNSMTNANPSKIETNNNKSCCN